MLNLLFLTNMRFVRCLRMLSSIHLDDLKLCVSTIGDIHALQGNLDSLFKRCTDNDVILNPYKCKAIIFSSFKTSLLNTYTINDINLERIDLIKDFGVIFNNKLNFNERVHNY